MLNCMYILYRTYMSIAVREPRSRVTRSDKWSNQDQVSRSYIIQLHNPIDNSATIYTHASRSSAALSLSSG